MKENLKTDEGQIANPACALCEGENRICMTDIITGKRYAGTPPPGCPYKEMQETIEKSIELYKEPENAKMALISARQEFQNYEWLPGRKLKTNITRIEEIMDFAKKMGYKKIGIAFCAGLPWEGKVCHQIFEAKGFEVVSVCCKCSSTPKDSIGIKEYEKIRGPGTLELMCSPITQALVLNKCKVDLAVLMGLCVGHDTLFIKYLEVPVVVFAVKDRVFGHNPIQALYLSQGPYYARLLKPEPWEAEAFLEKTHGRYDDILKWLEGAKKEEAKEK